MTMDKMYITEPDHNRATGRTTRNVDNCIQLLFQTGSCTCIDHTGKRENNFYLMDKIVWRLKHEHHVQPGRLVIDRSNFTIKLKEK
jgi:hypothetical protein